MQLDQPTHDNIENAYNSHPSQITFTPGSGINYITLNNAHGPFRNEELRKAVSTKYMKAAGYPSGRYTGSATLQVVGASNGDFPDVTQIVTGALTRLGFRTHVTNVDAATMFGKYCGVPKQEIDVCPSAGWTRDFADPLTVLYTTFYGPAIVSANNSNWSQQNDPQINAAIHQAALVVEPAARYRAWANVDKLLVAHAVAVPGYFATQPNIESGDVNGVNDIWNIGTWDFAFTSLKNP